jgi:hypothetical protein
LPEETQEKIRKAVAEKAAPSKTDDGGYSFQDRIVVGTATK